MSAVSANALSTNAVSRPDVVIIMTDQERAAPSYESDELAAWHVHILLFSLGHDFAYSLRDSVHQEDDGHNSHRHEAEIGKGDHRLTGLVFLRNVWRRHSF